MTIGVEVERLLYAAIGLDAASIGSATIERAVQERMAACKLIDASEYWQHLRGSETELSELVEAVVVPETWFFRDRQAFVELVRIAGTEWLPGNPQRVLRLLHIPCSTGEEPYSAAMALLDAGIAPDRFRIDGVDISERALARARHAVYGRNSFRGEDLGFRDRHFTPLGARYRLDPAVRAPVRFLSGNLLAQDFLPGSESYDAIFCRNVLIYFDDATQHRAVDVLQRLLRTGGVLFVGPAESGLLLRRDFVSAQAPLAFAFRKRPAQAPEPQHAPRRHRVVAAPFPAVPRQAPARSVPARHVPVRSTPEAGIEGAARLADQGRLGEALRVCEEHVRAHGPSARTFGLMGVICNASGELASALAHFRKALYLDPNDADALIHLALLLEKQGDGAGARRLRSRARRGT